MCKDDPNTLRIGHWIRMLDHAFVRKCMEIAREAGIDEFSLMHGHVLGFLYMNQEKAIHQRDLEAAFQVGRSSVSGVVKLMEKKGYITRQSDPGDARLKRLSLTQLGVSVCERSMAAIDQVEAIALEGLDQEELRLFFSLCRRIQENLGVVKRPDGGEVRRFH